MEQELARAEPTHAKVVVLRCCLLTHAGAQARGDGNDLTRKDWTRTTTPNINSNPIPRDNNQKKHPILIAQKEYE